MTEFPTINHKIVSEVARYFDLNTNNQIVYKSHTKPSTINQEQSLLLATEIA